MPLLLMVLLTVVVPNGILVKGAAPAASDASTPVPEEGRVADGRYRNAYFGLSYPIPAGWKEQPAGPPPSDGGNYVLTQFALFGEEERVKANVLVTAQDLFFSETPASQAKDILTAMHRGLGPVYEVTLAPSAVTIGGRTFHRFGYRARRSGLQWRVLTTDVRCHALTFTLMGVDTPTLDAAEQALRGISLQAKGPVCLSDYAANAIEKTDPFFSTNRFNTIPVRVIIGTDGRVKHVHLLSAFPEQSQAILGALRKWRFKPYREGGRAVEVETGIVFGMPRQR